MRNNPEAKKKNLRERLVKSAEALIAKNGLRGLKARDVTKDAGCALGAIYNAVRDLDELVMLVNARTLARLGQALRDALPENDDPIQMMHALAQAYVKFAQTETRLWSTIFNHRLPDGVDVPDWHAAEYAVLIEEIIAPLSKMRPDLQGSALKLRAQTIFAAVHGVVQLSIHGRFVGTPRDELASEVKALVNAMTRGINRTQQSPTGQSLG